MSFPFLLIGPLILAFSVAAENPRPVTADGFSVPSRPDLLEFPAAHGSHPEFSLEWWYLTGHLFAESGQRFGFQATFFRTTPGSDAAAAIAESTHPPTFGRAQFHLAHMALFDAQTGEFFHQERLNRDGWAARAKVGHLDVHNGNWFLRMTDPATESMSLRGGIEPSVVFQLDLRPLKPLVRFGDQGLSRKGDLPTSRSYYLTFPRLAVSGELRLPTGSFPVTGEAWMDHEITSGQLTPEQTGWDWVSIQLAKNEEIMAFRLRRADGSVDPASYLAHIDASGSVRDFYGDAFRWEDLSWWTSPQTGARYPVSFRLHLPEDLDGPEFLDFRPLANHQELVTRKGGPVYWEGAGDVIEDGPVVGRAFLEMTGYLAPVGGALVGR